MAAPEHLARHGSPPPPRALVHHRCIGWRWPGREGHDRWEFRHDGRWFEVAVSGPLVVDSRDFAVAAALEGMGIAFAVEQAVEAHVAAGRLLPLLEAWSAPFPSFFLCCPAQRQMAPALRAVIDAIVAGSRGGTGPSTLSA